MDLPAGFTISQTGGVASVECARCGECRSEPYRPEVVLVEWALAHRCLGTTKDPASASG